jgi:hypothetical protein
LHQFIQPITHCNKILSFSTFLNKGVIGYLDSHIFELLAEAALVGKCGGCNSNKNIVKYLKIPKFFKIKKNFPDLD